MISRVISFLQLKSVFVLIALSKAVTCLRFPIFLKFEIRSSLSPFHLNSDIERGSDFFSIRNGRSH